MFSTDFIFRKQENLVDNQKCQTGFRPLCNKVPLFIILGCAINDGSACVFPFQYDGTSYSHCTTKDHDQLWCATEVDANGDYVEGSWENCNGNCGTSKTSFVSVSLCENYYNDIQSFLDLPYSRKQKHVLLFRKSEILRFKVLFTNMLYVFFRKKTFLFVKLES